MARSMLKAKDMPKRFWGETVSTNVHIPNRCPTKKMLHKKLYEPWTCLNPSVGHFKVFKPLCFRYIPEQLRRKLDDRNQVMIFM